MFHENHQRYLLSQFRSIDKLFGEALANLALVDERRLFATYASDASPTQCQVLADHVAQLRFVLRKFLEMHSLRDSQTSVSALWSFRIAITFADTAVTELLPAYLRGYGEVDAESAASIQGLFADLKTLLRRMAEYLDQGEGVSIAARLAELDSTSDQIALLRALDRIIGAHGFVELRAPLAQLVERAASPHYEVAVFGRVNAGKSSLLNWWLGQSVLPTGVTPVTSVPTRIAYGNTGQVRLTLTSLPPSLITLGELPSYVTEAGNPGNHKGVLDITVELTAPRLRQGVCLVDTPGLGSLATIASVQTLQYLPRCDLGVLAIEAGGVVGRDEIDVARALLDGGSELLFVLSKSDHLAPAELCAAQDYISDQLRNHLGIDLTVHPISTLSAHAELTETWFVREIEPRLAAFHEQSTAALRRKTGVLKEAVIALLHARSANAHGDSPSAGLATDLSQARSALEGARQELGRIGLQLQSLKPLMLHGAVDAMAQGWVAHAGDPLSIVAQVATALAQPVIGIATTLASRYAGLRELLVSTVEQTPNSPMFPVELPLPRGMPVFEVTALQQLVCCPRPRGLWALRPLLRASANRRFGRRFDAAVEGQLASYGDALRHWGNSYLAALAQQLDIALGAAEGLGRISVMATLVGTDLGEVNRDLETLQRWH